MPRYKLTISYDGTSFSGWQRQPDARTVEQELEDAFSSILQMPVDLVGQGRTDAGVHASGQVAHTDLPDDANMNKLIHGVNGTTNQDVFIRSWEAAEQNFHARFDALSRTYQYHILLSPDPLSRHHAWYPGHQVKMEEIRVLASGIIGNHDFRGFSKIESKDQNPRCMVSACDVHQVRNGITLTITANRFLRHLVRRLAGTMVQVSAGRFSKQEFSKILSDPDPSATVFTAPPQGLNLLSVSY